MFNTNLYVSLSGGGETQSFEYSEWNFSILEYSIKLIAIYRPPYSAAHPVLPGKLFEEFSNYLEDIFLCPEILLITGDFNFHLDDTVNRNTIKFYEMLETFGLKQHVFENFRPVSNLSFLSKITEKAAANQLLNHCEKHAPLPICQSGFRKYHSTETALLKVRSDILQF